MRLTVAQEIMGSNPIAHPNNLPLNWFLDSGLRRNDTRTRS